MPFHHVPQADASREEHEAAVRKVLDQYRPDYLRGVKIIGATAHFVTERLDEGPIIAQAVVPVDHSHSAAEMAQAGRDVEKIVLAQALKLLFEGRIFLSGNRTIVFD